MKIRAITICTAALAAFASVAQAQATTAQDNSGAATIATSPDVNLTPRRVVFSPADRGVKEITVFNRTIKSATYSIVLVDQVMTPEGALVASDQAPAAQKERLKSATDWIRYSPRQVVLGPNESQTVRVQARRPASAAPGEYRTHFSVTAVPPVDTGLDIADAAGAVENKELRIRLTPVYGIMIPIIVRTAELPAQASISDVRVSQSGGRKALQFALNRTGDRSVYGGIDAFLLGSGKPTKIAQIRGVGVYGEVDQRRMALPIVPGVAVGPGSRVQIVFTDDEFKPGTVLAQTEVAIP